jgi:hypothetical protein
MRIFTLYMVFCISGFPCFAVAVTLSIESDSLLVGSLLAFYGIYTIHIVYRRIVSGVVGRGLGLGVVGIRRILIRHNVGIMRRGLKKYAGGFGCLVHRGRRIRVPPSL